MWSLVLFVAGLCSLPSFVNADRNVTVDDTDSAIKYSGNGWIVSTGFNGLNFGGFHHLSDQKNAVATFTFTGAHPFVFRSGISHLSGSVNRNCDLLLSSKMAV
jgi:hypothetical protein